ncbi:hypothetical protein [Haladaptatus sp. DYF46]|uniref:hypothetical protein n=1 Tax=Haladaptatus sp. DYF46 TaxID=2886041 RepID=UPI001E513260|nr:hypothetical protein [Haladaptatus sp. DYF46]
MNTVAETNGFAFGIVVASLLLFLAYVLLGTPFLAIPPILLLLGWCVVRYAPEDQRVRFAFLAAISVGLAGAIVPTLVFESDWTRSLDSSILLVAALTGSLAVLWASVETTNRLTPTA